MSILFYQLRSLPLLTDRPQLKQSFFLSLIFSQYQQWLNSNCWTWDHEYFVLPTALAITALLHSLQTAFFLSAIFSWYQQWLDSNCWTLRLRVNCSTDCTHYHCWLHSNHTLFYISAMFFQCHQWLDSNCWTQDYEYIVLPTALATTVDCTQLKLSFLFPQYSPGTSSG